MSQMADQETASSLFDECKRLQAEISESKRREAELRMTLNAKLQNMAIECGEAQVQLKRKREEVDELTARVKTLEDALNGLLRASEYHAAYSPELMVAYKQALAAKEPPKYD